MNETIKQHTKEWISANFCDGDDRSKATADVYNMNIIELMQNGIDLLEHLVEALPENEQLKQLLVTEEFNGPALYETFHDLVNLEED